MAKTNGKLKASNGSSKKFNGVVKLDVRDSKADWPAFLDQANGERLITRPWKKNI